MDKIIISALRVFAYHGVNESEKQLGQSFIIDVEAGTDISVPCATDSIDDTVSYAKMIKAIRRIMTAESNDLIERAAQRIADGLFEEFSAIKTLEITLKKPDAPIKADFDYVAVKIKRERQTAAK